MVNQADPAPYDVPVPALALAHVSKAYESSRRLLTLGARAPSVLAVNDVSLEIRRGEILGLIGASGSGKTTLGKIAVRLVDPSSGVVRLNGHDITSLSGATLRRYRRQFQMIYQDPYQSLNPRMTVRQLVDEPLGVHERQLSRLERVDRVLAALAQVGLSPSKVYLERYPHELSGGQRQRVAIARAVTIEPELIVADEPVSMLDVSVRAEILALLAQFRDRFGTTQLFITHDLHVARQLCDRLAVMNSGRIVEEGSPSQIIDAPQAPYTQQLIAALPERRVHPRHEPVASAAPVAIGTL